MISSWVLKKSHGDVYVEAYLRNRRLLIEGRKDGDPDWGLIYDQLLQYNFEEGQMGGNIKPTYYTVLNLKEKR